MDVERVDFVSFLTQDIARAKQFYAETLGLELESEGESDMEFRCGQVTLDIFDPSSIGQPFAPCPPVSRSASRTSRPRAPSSSRRVLSSMETITTSVCKQAWFKDPDGNALMLHRRFDA